jgi:hypothetical protein
VEHATNGTPTTTVLGKVRTRIDGDESKPRESRMNAAPAIPSSSASDVPLLLRGDIPGLTGWLEESSCRRLIWCMVLMVVASGIYGASIGCWRSSLQAVYTAIKFPLILLLTATGNALINSILAPLLNFTRTGLQLSCLEQSQHPNEF